MKTNLLLLITSILACTMLSAQATSSIRGQIKDEKGEGIPFVNIVLTQNGTFVKGGQSDYDGNYDVGPLESGLYELEAIYVDFKTTKIERILVKAGTATEYNFKMEVAGIDPEEITIIEYKEPIKKTPISGQTLTAEDFMNRGTMDLTVTNYSAPRPTPTDEGRATYSIGTRVESNTSYPNPNAVENLNAQTRDNKVLAQTTSSIRGQIKDEKGEGLSFANIVLTQNGTFVKGGQTDFDGNYEIGQIESGFYDLEASFVGYKTTRTERIVVKKDAATEHSFQMELEGENVDEIVIIDYKVPLIKTTPTVGQTLTAEDFQNRGCGSYSSSLTPEVPKQINLNIHDFFNEPQTPIESERKIRLATDRDARALKSGQPYTDPLENVATLE